MKKIILSMLILVLSLSVFLGVTTIFAEDTDYSRYYQINAGVKFGVPSDATIQKFELPVGYWVELISSEGDLRTVKYNGITLTTDGDNFAKMGDTYSYKTMDKIYYRQNEPIHATLSDEGIRSIFNLDTCSKQEGAKVISTIDSTDTPLTFLNSKLNAKGELVYVVAVDGKIGYIKADFTDAKTLNPKDTPWVAPIEVTDGNNVIPDTGSGDASSVIKPNQDSTTLPVKNNVVKVILIVAICVLSAVLVFLVFKPTRNKRSGRYSVDNEDDYERDDSYSDRY